jgi:hypothetical protein
VWAALVLAREWVVAGMPVPTIDQHFGGYEDWTHVIGGILEHSELGAILGNVSELRASNRDATVGAFLEAAWLKFANAEWLANAAIELAQEHLDLDIGSDERLAHQVGNKLRTMLDRPYGGYVLRKPGRTQSNSAKWTIEKLKKDEEDDE